MADTNGAAPDASGKKIYSLQTLDRALELLQVMAKAQTPLTVIELSKLLKMNRTTIYAMINSLLEGEFIERDPFPGRYVLGYKMFELGCMYRRRYSFLRNVRYYALPLIQKWDLCMRISVYIPGGFSLLLLEEYQKILPIINEGVLLPAHATASGKVLLSGLPPEDFERELEKIEYEAYTSNTIIDKNNLLERIETVRKQGYDIDNEEYLLGFSCLAVPIKDVTGAIIAALSVSGHPDTMAQNKETIIKDTLNASAIWSPFFAS